MTPTTRWLLHFARFPAAAAAVVGLAWLLATAPRRPTTDAPPRCYDPDIRIGGHPALAPPALCQEVNPCRDGASRVRPSHACP